MIFFFVSSIFNRMVIILVYLVQKKNEDEQFLFRTGAFRDHSSAMDMMNVMMAGTKALHAVSSQSILTFLSLSIITTLA